MQDITTQLHHLFRRFSVMLLAILMVSLVSTEVLLAEEDIITDIILINGQAELADFTKKGEVLTRHTAIPDYFTSGRSHKRSLRNSLQLLKALGNVEEITPKVYHAPVECRQSLMSVRAEDIAEDTAIESIGLPSTSATAIYTPAGADIINMVSSAISLVGQSVAKSSDFVIRKQHLDLIHRSYVISEDQLLISMTSKAMYDV